MTDITVAPPAPLPWDVDAVAQSALELLRLTSADIDADRMLAMADTATTLIDAELDYAVSPTEIPGAVFDAAVNLTVELYRRKDAPFGVLDSWSVDGAAIRLSADVMRGTRKMLAPFVSRWGVG